MPKMVHPLEKQPDSHMLSSSSNENSNCDKKNKMVEDYEPLIISEKSKQPAGMIKLAIVLKIL